MNQKLKQFLQQVKEQEWYQQIQSVFQQLSPEQQTYVKWGTISSFFIAFLVLTWNIMSHSNGIKNEFYQKLELTQVLNQGSDELRRLKGQSAGINQSSSQTWKKTLESLVSTQGLPPESIEILKETQGNSQNVIQEFLLEVMIKGISVQPLVQLLYQMEHSQPPMKLKGMKIEPVSGGSSLNARLNLSGYMAKEVKSR
jgi:hypothetical protein